MKALEFPTASVGKFVVLFSAGLGILKSVQSFWKFDHENFRVINRAKVELEAANLPAEPIASITSFSGETCSQHPTLR